MTGPAKMRAVGVLGGMGPEATVLFMSRVITLTPASDDSDHVPMLIDNNTQVPSRIKAIIEKTDEDPGTVLVAMARRLAEAGVEALAMPCNTAYHYAPLLKEAVSIPFLDMVELTAEHIACLCGSVDSSAVFRVGMLASPAVRITGVFDRAFAARGLNPVYPLVACSELSLINDSLAYGIPVVDTIDVLAEAVIAFSRNELVRKDKMGTKKTAAMSAYVSGDTSQ